MYFNNIHMICIYIFSWESIGRGLTTMATITSATDPTGSEKKESSHEGRTRSRAL